MGETTSLAHLLNVCSRIDVMVDLAFETEAERVNALSQMRRFVAREVVVLLQAGGRSRLVLVVNQQLEQQEFLIVGVGKVLGV